MSVSSFSTSSSASLPIGSRILSSGTSSTGTVTIPLQPGRYSLVCGTNIGYTWTGSLLTPQSTTISGGVDPQVAPAGTAFSATVAGNATITMPWGQSASPIGTHVANTDFVKATNGSGVTMIINTTGSVYTTTDNVNYTLKSTNVPLVSSSLIAQLAVNTAGTTWIYTADGGSAYRSTDLGVTWTAFQPSGLTYLMTRTVLWVGSVFGLYVYSNSATGTETCQYFTSPDGVTWTSRTISGSTGGGGVTSFLDFSASTGTLAILASSRNTQTYYTSNDGITWTGRTIPNGSTYVNRPKYVNNIFLWITYNSASTVSHFITSADAATWTTQITSAAGTNIPFYGSYANHKGFSYVNSIWFCGGNRSVDLVTWTTTNIAFSTGVYYLTGTYYCYNSNIKYISTNGLTGPGFYTLYHYPNPVLDNVIN